MYPREMKTYVQKLVQGCLLWDFPTGTADKNPPANAGDLGLVSGPGRFHMWWSN